MVEGRSEEEQRQFNEALEENYLASQHENRSNLNPNQYDDGMVSQR